MFFQNDLIEGLRYMFAFQLTEGTEDVLLITYNIHAKEVLPFTLNIFLTLFWCLWIF